MRRPVSRRVGNPLFLLGFLWSAAFLASSPPAFSQQAPPQAEQGEFKIFARDWEKRKDKILASGNVEIHYKAVKLFADRVDINPETKDAYAEGHVTIVLPEEVITAERIFLNLDDSRGKLEKAYGMIQPTISYEAQSIER